VAGQLDAVDGSLLLAPDDDPAQSVDGDRPCVVFTVSGGIQEETTFLGVPCLTLWENTERPATTASGTNELVKLVPAAVAGRGALPAGRRPTLRSRPPLRDGHAAERMAEVLERVV